MLAVIALAAIGVLVVAADWQDIRRSLSEADWELTLIALVFITAAYLCLSYRFVAINRLFDIRMKRHELFRIGYVSIALNKIVASLGVAGHSLRVMLMQPRGVATGKVLAASLCHSHFYNLVIFCLLPLGLIYLLINGSVSKGAILGLGLTVAALITVLIIGTMMVFMRSLRISVLRIINAVSRLVIRRDISSFLNSFDEAMTIGVSAVKEQPSALVMPLVLTAAEWIFTVVALWFCSDAVGSPLSMGVLFTGLAVGVPLGSISMIPGGLGIQEASMSGVYVLLGVSFEQAILVSILFRVIYSFIPFAISLLLYRRLLQSSETSIYEGQADD